MFCTTYKRLGDFIEAVDERNRDLSISLSQGINNNKYFQEPRQVAENSANDKIVRKGYFAYNRATTRNGDKISIAYREGPDCTVSSAYQIFRIVDEEKLNPHYLLLWFKRPRFDRYARFKSHGSAHEFFEWEEMCNVMLPVPHIDEQRRIVGQYQAVENRIRNNERLIARLEETAQIIFNHHFVENIDHNNLPKGWKKGHLQDVCEIKGGKRLPKGEELQTEKTDHPYIRVADMRKEKFILLDSAFEYVSEDIQKKIERYVVNEGDIILSIVGTIGSINIIGENLDGANLTENCVKLINTKIPVSYIYHFLKSEEGKYEIEQGIVGGVQSKLPIYNIEKIALIIPNKDDLSIFVDMISKLDNMIYYYQQENTLLVQIQKSFTNRL